MRFDLDIRGVDKARHRILGVGDRSADLRPAFHKVAGVWLTGERRQFATKKGWPRLAESTRERKLRQGLPLRIMYETGQLERALTVRRAPGQSIRVTRTSISMGIKPNGKAFYGRFQGRYGRKVVVFTELAQRQSTGILGDYIVHGSRSLV